MTKDKAIERTIGIHTAISLPAWVTAKHSVVMAMIKNYARGKDKAILDMLMRAGIVLDIKVAKNIIVNTGLNVSARLRTGDTTYTGEITYGALGNGSSPSFGPTDTQLVAEVGRKIVTDAAFDGVISYHDFFFESGDIVNGTYSEWGTFIDGTGSADSGQAYSLLATGGWTKSGSLYVSSKYTSVNA